MQVNISSVKFKADQKLLDFIKLKVDKLQNYYEGVLGGDVILKMNAIPKFIDLKDNKITEIKLMIKGDDIFAKKQSKSFEESTDMAVEALRRQLRKHKGKLVDSNRK